MFRFLILGLLRAAGPRHGYALVKEYRERSGAEVSTGNFYRELQRLVLDGLIRAADNPLEADARRTPYEITALGARVFEEWLAAADLGAGGFSEDELSSRALFVEDIEPDAALALIERLQEQVWFAGKTLERVRHHLVSVPPAEAPARPDRFRPLPLLLNRRLKRVAADIEFLEELRAAYLAHLRAQPATSAARSVSVPDLPRRPARRAEAAVSVQRDDGAIGRKIRNRR